MGIIRVFLLDDHEIVRRGLAELIGLQSDLEVVGCKTHLGHVPRIRCTDRGRAGRCA